jgi:hypothetical protein
VIEYIIYAVKAIFLIIGGIGLNKGKLAYIPLLAVPLFMTGVELITDSDEPWSYLLLSGVATLEDFEKAVLGGSLMFLWPILFILICAKKFKRLSNGTEKIERIE